MWGSASVYTVNYAYITIPYILVYNNVMTSCVLNRIYLPKRVSLALRKNILLTCVYLLLSLQLSIIICITVQFIVFLMLQRLMIE